jgi:hypothetical protein
MKVLLVDDHVLIRDALRGANLALKLSNGGAFQNVLVVFADGDQADFQIARPSRRFSVSGFAAPLAALSVSAASVAFAKDSGKQRAPLPCSRPCLSD